MMSHQIGCQVTTSRSVQRPLYIGHLCLKAEETPLDYQRHLPGPESEAGGRP